MTYVMTFKETPAVGHILKAFVGYRWHMTSELVTHGHYSARQTLRVLHKLVEDGVVERTPSKYGAPILWRVVETRRCGYCGTTERIDHFYKNYRSGGYYPGCYQSRRDTYDRQKAKT